MTDSYMVYIVYILFVIGFFTFLNLTLKKEEETIEEEEYITYNRHASIPNIDILYTYTNQDTIVDELKNKNYDILSSVVELSDTPNKNYGLYFINNISNDIKNDPDFISSLRKATHDSGDINLLIDSTTEKRDYGGGSYDFMYNFYLVVLTKENIIEQRSLCTGYSKTYEK